MITVSQSCVSQGKTGGKCLKQPVLNQVTQRQSRNGKQCRSWKARGFQEQGRQGHTALCLSFWNKDGTGCLGTRPASDSVCTKARENCPAGNHVSRLKSP